MNVFPLENIFTSQKPGAITSWGKNNLTQLIVSNYALRIELKF